MTQKLLAAIDLEHAGTATRVLQEAARLAGFYGAELDVITVIPSLGGGNVATYFHEGAEEKMLEDANAALHTFVRAALGPDTEVRHIVAHGTAYEEIIAMAARIKADLIVMGAHRPALRDYLLGPNAARVARHATCSVHILRDPA